MEADELYDLMPEYKNAAKQAVEQIKAIIDVVLGFIEAYSRGFHY